jgi:tRNA modification GTPase
MRDYSDITSGDTIVALATPQGVGAIGVIRLSGQEAIHICNKVFTKDLHQQATHTIHYGSIKDGSKVLDDVVVSLFKEPKSYTKENVVEISCHGSPFILQKVIEVLIDKGARLAKPGEFTMRAFLNGSMDLSQAEAVADLIASNSASSHDNAMKQLRGGFSSKIKELKDQLVHFASLVELELDFSEEDVEFADRQELKDLINNIKTMVRNLIDSFKLGNAIKNGVSTVIAGRPNAGKSTLLNALLQEERAIVSDIPGTTRDTIEETINIGGIQFRLIDTAGIRDATDKIETMGVEKTMEQIKQSAIIVYLFDVSELSKKELQNDLAQLGSGDVPLIVIGNKIDLNGQADEQSYQEKFGLNNALFVSSKDGNNIEKLGEQLLATVQKDENEKEDVIVSNARHTEALQKADQALDNVLEGMDNQISGELLALDIRESLQHLGEITGDITTDDLLENIFSKFCIGK